MNESPIEFAMPEFPNDSQEPESRRDWSTPFIKSLSRDSCERCDLALQLKVGQRRSFLAKIIVLLTERLNFFGLIAAICLGISRYRKS
jgi:DNA-directed RNA polymerase